MADKIETYDCTSGSAQHCYGCYTMEECKQRYGDWVRKEVVRARLIDAKSYDDVSLRYAIKDLIAELTDGEW